jgi:hypothetical protein
MGNIRRTTLAGEAGDTQYHHHHETTSRRRDRWKETSILMALERSLQYPGYGLLRMSRAVTFSTYDVCLSTT